MRKNSLRHEWPMHLMLLPPMIVVLIFSYGPMFGFVMAFQRFIPARGIWGSEWIGFDNFTYVFHLPGFTQVLYNTVLIAGLKIVTGLVVPITVALLLNEMRREFIKRTVQTLIYLPHFLSWVILGGILTDILSPSKGLVNEVVQRLGADSIFFLGDNAWFPFTLIVSNEWKEFGFGTIIYLAAIAGVSPHLYEAAVIDGASRWRQAWHVTLPAMGPIIILMATLSMGSVLNAGFDQVFNLYSPVVYESGDIIDTFVYRIGMIDAQYGVATAVGLFKSGVSLLFISVSYYLAYRLVDYRIF